MTNATVRVLAEESYAADSDCGDQIGATELERVSVSFAAEEGYGTVCRLCGREVVEDDGKWIDPEAAGDDVVWRETCGEASTIYAEHEPETGPGTWCNSAAIVVDDEEDSVTVTVSVGDPRGAFAFTVRRIPTDASSEHAGRLVLHVPYPGEGMPHETLTEIHAGTFLIGGAR